MSAQPRILHVADFSAPYPGAFIRQLRMLDEELVGAGARSCAFAFPQRAAGRPWLESLRADGYDVVLLPEPRARGSHASTAVIADSARALGATVIHTHFGTYDVAAVRAVRWLKRQAHDTGRGVPRLVWHYRTALEVPVWRRSILRRLKDWIRYSRAGREVDMAVAVTQALAEEAADRGLGSTVRAVVAGCDTDAFRPDALARGDVRRELGIEDDQLLVLHLGWHWHRKGGDLLAEAARQLRERGRDDLVFCSVDAPIASVEAPVVRLEPTDQIARLYQACDIFVSASRSEGFGNGLVEAMACARVAVAAVVEGQREVFTGVEGCVAVRPGDAAAIADGIMQLLGQRSSWDVLGAGNRARVCQRHSMRRWASDMVLAYAEVGIVFPGVPLDGQEMTA